MIQSTVVSDMGADANTGGSLEALGPWGFEGLHACRVFPKAPGLQGLKASGPQGLKDVSGCLYALA
jgi:hypothetical protein